MHEIELRQHLLVENALCERKRVCVAFQQALRNLVGFGVQLISGNGVIHYAHRRQLSGSEGTRQHEIFLRHIHRHF